MNLAGGRLIDSIGSRKVLNVMIGTLILIAVTLPFSSSTLPTSVVAILVFGACAWGQLVPQQHRLVGIMPQAAPIVLGLNTSGTYIGVASAGLVGEAAIGLVGASNIGWVSLALYVSALIAAEMAHRSIAARKPGASSHGLAEGRA